MKTMMTLLIRVQQLRDCCQRTKNNHQVTEGEKSSVRLFKQLVRDCLPREVLRHYDQLKQTEPELFQSPEIFAMAVLVDTYRSLSPAGRKRLLAHFATPLPLHHQRNGTVRSRRNDGPRRGVGLCAVNAVQFMRGPCGAPAHRAVRR
jgi:hypothetical protein